MGLAVQLAAEHGIPACHIDEARPLAGDGEWKILGV
jgi:hypothetical protein